MSAVYPPLEERGASSPLHQQCPPGALVTGQERAPMIAAMASVSGAELRDPAASVLPRRLYHAVFFSFLLLCRCSVNLAP